MEQPGAARPDWAQIPELSVPCRAEARAEDKVEGLPAPAVFSRGEKAPNLPQPCSLCLQATEQPDRAGRVSTGGACAGTSSTLSLPGNYRGAGERKLLQAAWQRTASRRAKPGQRHPEGHRQSHRPTAHRDPAVPSEDTGIRTALMLPTYFSVNSGLNLSKGINSPLLLSRLACHKCLKPAHHTSGLGYALALITASRATPS